MDFQFPTTKHLEEYISNIEKYTEDEVKDLIYQFIIPSAFLGNDRSLMDWVFDSGRFDINTILKHESFLRRLICMNEKKSTMAIHFLDYGIITNPSSQGH